MSYLIEVAVKAVETPIGVVTIHVSGRSSVVMDVVEAVTPELPEGMVVDGVILLRIGIKAPVTRELPLRLSIVTDLPGHAETGQGLESMRFASSEGILQVAVHDDEWLSYNGFSAECVRYGGSGFDQIVTGARAGSERYVSLA